jgi:hypothetical protein
MRLEAGFAMCNARSGASRITHHGIALLASRRGRL